MHFHLVDSKMCWMAPGGSSTKGFPWKDWKHFLWMIWMYTYTKTLAHTFQHEAECFSNSFLVAPTSKRNWKPHIQRNYLTQPNSLLLPPNHPPNLWPFSKESELARVDWQDKCPPKITWMGHGICGANRIYHVGWIQWIISKNLNPMWGNLVYINQN